MGVHGVEGAVEHLIFGEAVLGVHIGGGLARTAGKVA